MVNDFSTLQQEIVRLTGRADLTFDIPSFIQMAEARMNRDLRLSP
jgi:hypothetical protein